MKIDAKVEFSDRIAEILNKSTVIVAVDIDYVEDNEESVNEWIANELESKYEGFFINGEDFKVTNMAEVLEDIKFDEFKNKTEC